MTDVYKQMIKLYSYKKSSQVEFRLQSLKASSKRH